MRPNMGGLTQKQWVLQLIAEMEQLPTVLSGENGEEEEEDVLSGENSEEEESNQMNDNSSSSSPDPEEEFYMEEFDVDDWWTDPRYATDLPPKNFDEKYVLAQLERFRGIHTWRFTDAAVDQYRTDWPHFLRNLDNWIALDMERVENARQRPRSTRRN